MTVTKKMIYIDNWVANGLVETEYDIIFKYLKDIISAIACKKGWFKGQELMNFTEEASTNIFMRIIQPEKSLVHKQGKPLTQIKNYLDICLYGASIKYRQKHYSKTLKNEDKYNLTEADIQKKLNQYAPTLSWEESELAIIFKDTLQSVPKIVKAFVKRNNDFYNEDLLYVNILINLIKVFSNLKLYKTIEVDRIVLYGIPLDDTPKITLLCRGAVREILKEFKELFGDSELTLEDFYQAVTSDFISHSLNDEGANNEF